LQPDAALRDVRDVLVDASSGVVRLGDAERESLAAYAARASWPAGFVVYQRSAAADGVFVVSRGRIVLRSRVRAGRGFVPWIACPGETFGSEGLSPSSRYATDARADEESETLFLSSARFRAFVREQPQHSLTLINQLMAERALLLDKLRELTTLSVEQRLIATLVRMASNNTFTGEDGRIVLCSARYRLLCELVGATRESVSLVLGRLASEGVVERSGTTLFVCGSTSAYSRELVDQCLRSGITVYPMPGSGAAAWIEPVAAALARDGRALMNIGRPIDRSPGAGARLQTALAEAVARLLIDHQIDNLLVEGGATASAVCRRMGWEDFHVEAELCPGVVQMRIAADDATSAPKLIIKPGSYPWPQQVFAKRT